MWGPWTYQYIIESLSHEKVRAIESKIYQIFGDFESRSNSKQQYAKLFSSNHFFQGKENERGGGQRKRGLEKYKSKEREREGEIKKREIDLKKSRGC